MAVYLLHFDEPIGGPGRNGAQHYVGWCEPWQFNTRMRAHRNGTSGAKIVTAFHKKGIGFWVARVWWDGGPELEKYLKRNGHHDQNCPVCTHQQTLLMRSHELALASEGNLPAAKRYAERTRASGGGRQRGNQTASTGSSQVELPLEPSTTSGVRAATEPPMTGGNATRARARRSSPSGPSAGTKPVSRSR